MVSLAVEWYRPELIHRVDESLRDMLVQLAAKDSAETRVVLVDIDEASLKSIGPWPWSRQRLADLAEDLLGTYGARAVGFDIVLPDPGDAAGDARLASLASSAPLILAQIFDFVPRSEALSDGVLAGGATASVAAPHAVAHGFIANHAGLAQARCIGNIGYVPDADGVLRHTPAATRFGDRIYPQLAQAMVACGSAAISKLPSDSDGMWRVPYSYAPGAYTVIGVKDILERSAPRSLLAGRYVIVGSSSLGLGDRVSTPLSALTAGFMVHAASLSGILDLADGRVLPPWSGRWAISLWIVGSVTLALACIVNLSAFRSVLILGGLMLVWMGTATFGAYRQAEWSLTAPLWGYLLLVSVGMPLEWWNMQKRSRKLLETFSHYVAKPVLDEIVRLGLIHSLEPTQRDVTVLIADMEGYTRTTSSLSLEDAAVLTKDFLSCLTGPVLFWQGTLDKYSGDGLVAFWGAPLQCADRTDRALSAAQQILENVRELNARRQAMGFVPVRVRIGVESGRALVGDLGTSFRSTYTAVGDCINFASRLESAARDLPCDIVIGATANREVSKHQTYSLGTIQLRGTQTHIEVFTLGHKAE